MRQPEEMPPDPQVLAELDAIDATLAGEPVDPAHAELAELALLLTATRELPSEQFARTLDARAARRFVAVPAAESPRQRARARFSRWSARPAFASVLAGGFAAVVVASVIASGALSSGPAQTVVNGGAVHAHRAPATAYNSLTTNAGTPSGSTTSRAATSGKFGGVSSNGAAVQGVNLTQSVPPAAVPTPASNSATHVIQSAQLQLTTPNVHIDQVAQEVFNVVSLEDGTVRSSQVTQATGGDNGGSYATFALTVPTSNLQQTMARLSALQYADVSSRTDGTQNVGGQYAADQRHIADQEAVRAALLKQLQSAYTQSAIDSLQAQLKLTERQLASDQAALASLQHQIGYSSLQVQVNAGPIVFPLRTVQNHGFTVGRAAHDSVRVLIVATGVTLIALAVMVPLGLLAAVAAWVTYWLHRRRRQQALDAA
jgi:Domain of unknown function (DUF4349)